MRKPPNHLTIGARRRSAGRVQGTLAAAREPRLRNLIN